MIIDTKIRQAKAKDRDYKLSDYEGLYLLVRRTGAKLWRFNYRFAGKQKSLALGVYPTVNHPHGASTLRLVVCEAGRTTPCALAGV
jgi:hypothetical protein